VFVCCEAKLQVKRQTYSVKIYRVKEAIGYEEYEEVWCYKAVAPQAVN